ncbi:MAG TPA: phosphonoacetaldehyde phosphonohydrolase-related protein [Pseudomonas sp.]|uniref:phosphonoacetaldehyde phosphonohydrolase-related protein n=1 Tax=Pseudomonas sp. TaxID=306 RepID=UPI002B49931A|nr:phosphonoacetaldehyde phosphonohydrolase-related protein [Pseudomonas sp.]HKS14228.1 phosphonoacetaldehyde phosphonohydrolase-related protein [Pseudomonas sp.]
MPQMPALTAVLFGLRGCLLQTSGETPLPMPGALDALNGLRRQHVPCAWLEERDATQAQRLALPDWLPGHASSASPWPAPDACWQALMGLGVERLEGCVLVSGEPRLLQAGLNAGLWTVGLAACTPQCGLPLNEWRAMTRQEQDCVRGKATLTLFELGVHSVIDHFEALDNCLDDIAQRRHKGEKP